MKLYLRCCLLLLALICAGQVVALEIAVAPLVDQSGLPVLGADWLKTNPYRTNVRAIEVGRSAFNQSCARCHGLDASSAAAPAPDLRQLNRYCLKIGDGVLRVACMADNDAYFSKTVQQGKVIVGVMHMPPWKDVLNQELVWAIQVFIESRTGMAQ